MSTTLTSRLAEHLVCAELARCELTATTFTHNVPLFDILVAHENGHCLPIQVKSTNSESWRTSAETWMQITFDDARQIQNIGAKQPLTKPDLIWICVTVASSRDRDRFFILTASEIQEICVASHHQVLAKHNGHRPRNWKSTDCWWNVDDLKRYENNWDLIKQRLGLNESS